VEKKGTSVGNAYYGEKKKRKWKGWCAFPCTGKSAPTGEEETKESRGRRGSARGQAMRSIVRIEEELNRGAEEESERALWQRGARKSTVAKIGVVYPGNDSNL